MAVSLDQEQLIISQQCGLPQIGTIENQVFHYRHTIDLNLWKAKGLGFKNCTFNGQLEFKHIDLQAGVRFENCTFDRALLFQHCAAGQVQPDFNGNTGSIALINCQFNDLFVVRDCKLHFGIYAALETKFNGLQLLNLESGKIQFIDTTINGRVEMDVIACLSGVFWERVQVHEYCYIDNYQGRFSLDYCTFQEASLVDCNFSGLFISDTLFTGALYLHGCGSSVMSWLNCNFEKEVEIDAFDGEEKAAQIRELKIMDSAFKSGCRVLGSELNAETYDVADLHISCGEQLNGNLEFSRLKVGSTHIYGTNGAAITFVFCALDRLFFEQLVNRGNISLISTGPLRSAGSSWKIDRCLLGKLILSDIDLSRFEQFFIAHSNLTEIVTNAVWWFRDEQLITEDRGLRKDVYRQLKFAMDKQGDRYNSLRFKRDEQLAYHLELKAQRLTRHNAGDKFILWVGQSNDYGFNWIKPLLLILGSVTVFYVLLAISASPDLHWYPDLRNFGPTWSYLEKNSYNVFNLLNPAHKISELFDQVKTGQRSFGFYAWDFLERLVLSYLILQLISAFRKYTATVPAP